MTESIACSCRGVEAVMLIQGDTAPLGTFHGVRFLEQLVGLSAEAAEIDECNVQAPGPHEVKHDAPMTLRPRVLIETTMCCRIGILSASRFTWDRGLDADIIALSEHNWSISSAHVRTTSNIST